MEKLILKDGTIFDALPLGIVPNDVTKRRRLIFKSELDYNTVLSILSNTDNVSQITYTLENGAVIAVYNDCVALKTLSYDIDNKAYTAELSTDPTEKLIQDLQAKVQSMEEIINSLIYRNIIDDCNNENEENNNIIQHSDDEIENNDDEDEADLNKDREE